MPTARASSDEELMERAAAGDREAFGVLFDRHHAPLRGFLCRFMGDPGGADDTAQEVFWRMWLYRATYERGRPFRGWLYRIARNTALDELRKAGRQPEPLSALAPEQAERAATGPGPEDRLLGAALRAEVRRALLALPADQRLCVVLRDYEELSHAEIAAALACTEGNARVLYHRARKTLRALLRPYLAETGEEAHV